MRKHVMMTFLAAGLVLAAGVSAYAQGTDPLAIIKSDAPFKDKADACRELSISGKQDAIPVLAAMLTDEKVSHIARAALEPMPYPEAGAVLRDALGKTGGILKVGVINSLAIRKDKEAVPTLGVLLSDADADVLQAAADALGMIATPEAVAALDNALKQSTLSPVSLQCICDGLLSCAEQLATTSPPDQLMIYDGVIKIPGISASVHSAALRGRILARGKEAGLLLLMESLRGDENDFNTALRAGRELGMDEKVSSALAEVLPTLAPERKVALMDLLATGKGDALGAAIQKEAGEGAQDVRIAALRALTRLAYAPVVSLLETEALAADDSELTKTARELLCDFPGGAGVEAIKAMLTNAKPEIRRVAVDLVDRAGLDNPSAILLNVAQNDADEATRVAALKQLQTLAGVAELPGLLDVLIAAKSPADVQTSEKTLTSVCERQKRASDVGKFTILSAVYGALPDGPSADVADKVKEMVAAGARAISASNDKFGEPAPGLVKQLRIEYTENEISFSKTAKEGETLKLSIATAPDNVVDAFCSALDKAQGESKLAVVRLLGCAGSRKALEAVRGTMGSADAAVKETATRVVCDWPTPDAFPAVMDLAKTSKDEVMRILALRGAVRLLELSTMPTAEKVANYGALLASAGTPDEKKSVLGGLSQVSDAAVLEQVLAQLADESVKAEAAQAAIAIARTLGRTASEDGTYFNGTDLTGWTGNMMSLWSVKDGVIVGQSDGKLKKNEFVWSPVEVRDFFLAMDVKLDPNTGNAGIQVRSSKKDERGQALGYQADIGKDVWGRLYHEAGRGKLDWVGGAEPAVVPGEWNRVEILGIGPALWISINGQLGTACLDVNGERSGTTALQVHVGPPETVYYRPVKLVHNPKVEMTGLSTEALINALRLAEGK